MYLRAKHFVSRCGTYTLVMVALSTTQPMPSPGVACPCACPHIWMAGIISELDLEDVLWGMVMINWYSFMAYIIFQRCHTSPTGGHQSPTVWQKFKWIQCFIRNENLDWQLYGWRLASSPTNRQKHHNCQSNASSVRLYKWEEGEGIYPVCHGLPIYILSTWHGQHKLKTAIAAIPNKLMPFREHAPSQLRICGNNELFSAAYARTTAGSYSAVVWRGVTFGTLFFHE